MDFEGKTAAIIGGGGGIGRAIALALAGRGADVLVGDVDASAAAGVAAEVVALGRRGEGVRCDLGSDDSVNAFADVAFEKLGRVDLLFNHAGVSLGGLLEQISTDDWNWLLNVNIVGLGRSVRAFVPRMGDGGGGHIVNTSSGLGLFHDLSLAGPYLCTKAAIVAYSRALAVYLRNRGIGVSVFCPDLTRTAFVGSGRIIGIPPEFLAGALSSDRAQTAEQAAELLLAGLEAETFLISAVPDTAAKLASMAASLLAPGSDNPPAATAPPIVQKGSITVPAERRDEILALCASFAAQSRTHAGCIVYDATVDIEDPAMIRIVEVWRDATSIDSHGVSPDTMRFVAQMFGLGVKNFSFAPVAT